MSPVKRMSEGIGESPLLTGENRIPKMNSTINPGKFDHAKFTEIREMESEGGSLRIIITVVLVIVVGVGLALLVRNLISNNQTTDNVEETPTVVESAIEINKVAKTDATASKLASNTDYEETPSLSLGATNSKIAEESLDKIEYQRYTTFGRVKFDLSTIALPKTTLAYDALKNQLTVTFTGLTNFAEDLKKDIEISDIVKDVRFDELNNRHIIVFNEKSSYRVFTEAGDLFVDVKTQAELDKAAESTTDDTTDTTDSTQDNTTDNQSTTVDANKPAAPFYENAFSQIKQYVSSTANTKSIALDTYYVDDYGASFGFSWGQKNKVGDAYVPNATAYYDESVSGKVYLIVEIQNLSGDVFTLNGVKKRTAAELQTITGVDTSHANFVSIELLSFDSATGISKYRLELNSKKDFKLLSQKTFDNTTQVLSIEIKD